MAFFGLPEAGVHRTPASSERYTPSRIATYIVFGFAG